MLRILFAFTLSAVLLAGIPGCGEKKKSAAELKAEKEKAFKERARVEAIKAYNALAEKFPESEFTEQAKERSRALGPLPSATPQKKK